MKGILIYKGKYGATRQYAEWIGSHLNIPVTPPGKLKNADLEASDYVIVGGSVYVGKWQLRNWVRQHSDLLQNKKLFIFIVCATPPDQLDKLQVIARNNIPPALLDTCHLFYLHGKMTVKKLSWSDRFFLKMGAKLEKDPVKKKEMLTDFNGVKRENIFPLVHEVRSTVFDPAGATCSLPAR